MQAPREDQSPASAGAGQGLPLHIRLDIEYSAILKVGGTILGVWLLGRAWSVVILLAVAVMLVATLTPLVRRLEARVNRRWGIVLISVGVVGVTAAVMAVMIPPLVRQGQGLLEHFPLYTQAIDVVLRKWRMPISISTVSQSWTAQAAALGPQILNVASSVLSKLIELMSVAVLTIYLLVDGPRVQMSLLRLLPRPERLPARQLLGTLAEQVGSYMRGQILTSVLAGLFSFVLLAACGVPEPLALAFWMALADAIPLVGLLLGGVPAVLLALTRGGSTALIVAAGYLIYHLIESNVLVPRIYGTTMKLSGSTILIAILLGATLMGVMGALLALPVAAAVPAVVRYIGDWRDRQTDRAEVNLP